LQEDIYNVIFPLPNVFSRQLCKRLKNIVVMAGDWLEAEKGMERNNPKRISGLRMLTALASIMIVIGGLKLAADLLLPIILAFFLSVVSLPILRALRARGVPRLPAVLLTVIVDIGILSPVVMIGLNLATEFQDKFEYYNLGLAERAEEFQGWAKEELDYELKVEPGEVMQGVETFVVGFLGGAAEFLKDFTFVLIIMIFFLTEAGGFTRKMGAIKLARGPDLARFAEAAKDIQKYLGIKTMISAVTGILAGILTWQLGLDFALLWGMVTFSCNYIPAIGSIIASIPPTLLALVDKTPGVACLVLLGFLAINMLLGNLIEPMLLGRKFGISVSMVILSVVFWGWLWGLIGMFLAVPLTMLLKVALDNSDEFQWLSVAMGKHDRIVGGGE
jgi:AI-2 transport protein TqsA